MRRSQGEKSQYCIVEEIAALKKCVRGSKNIGHRFDFCKPKLFNHISGEFRKENSTMIRYKGPPIIKTTSPQIAQENWKWKKILKVNFLTKCVASDFHHDEECAQLREENFWGKTRSRMRSAGRTSAENKWCTICVSSTYVWFLINEIKGLSKDAIWNFILSDQN